MMAAASDKLSKFDEIRAKISNNWTEKDKVLAKKWKDAIDVAYATLSNPIRKAEYDRQFKSDTDEAIYFEGIEEFIDQFKFEGKLIDTTRTIVALSKERVFEILENGNIGEFARVFNGFPLLITSADQKLISAIHPMSIHKLSQLYEKALASLANTDIDFENPLAEKDYPIVYACFKEMIKTSLDIILSPTGDIHLGIARALGCEELLTEKRFTHPEKAEHIRNYFLQGFMTQVVFGAVHQGYQNEPVAAGAFSHYFEHYVYEDKQFTESFKSLVKNQLQARQQAELQTPIVEFLKTSPLSQVSAMVTADLINENYAQLDQNIQKQLQDNKLTFWTGILRQILDGPEPLHKKEELLVTIAGCSNKLYEQWASLGLYDIEHSPHQDGKASTLPLISDKDPQTYAANINLLLSNGNERDNLFLISCLQKIKSQSPIQSFGRLFQPRINASSHTVQQELTHAAKSRLLTQKPADLIKQLLESAADPVAMNSLIEKELGFKTPLLSAIRHKEWSTVLKLFSDPANHNEILGLTINKATRLKDHQIIINNTLKFELPNLSLEQCKVIAVNLQAFNLAHPDTQLNLVSLPKTAQLITAENNYSLAQQKIENASASAFTSLSDFKRNAGPGH